MALKIITTVCSMPDKEQREFCWEIPKCLITSDNPVQRVCQLFFIKVLRVGANGELREKLGELSQKDEG